jgi:hypothetical protein
VDHFSQHRGGSRAIPYHKLQEEDECISSKRCNHGFIGGRRQGLLAGKRWVGFKFHDVGICVGLNTSLCRYFVSFMLEICR